MSMRTERGARAAMVGFLVALGAACDRPASTTVVPDPMGGHDHGASGVAAVIDDSTEAQLRALKQATAPFQDFAVAQQAGYTTQVTACFENLPLGAMGSHFGDASRFDATLEVTRPEVLLYAHKRGGGWELVGVEYIVPFSAWTDPNPPQLLGQTFVRNLTFNVWALHVWNWRVNPRGIFSDWNPRVSC